MNDSISTNYLATFGPPLIIAAATIAAALISARRTATQNRQATGPTRDPLTRAMAIFACGIALALLFSSLKVTLGQISLDHRVARLDEATKNQNNLLKFPRNPVRIKAEIYEMDREAAVIRENKSPSEWQTFKGKIEIDNVFFVGDSEWVPMVFPNSESDRITDERCILQPKGKLTVRGFSTDRISALIEYTAPSKSGGTSCDTGTYFFYPVPPLSLR